jgi:hypothetical protein
VKKKIEIIQLITIKDINQPTAIKKEFESIFSGLIINANAEKTAIQKKSKIKDNFFILIYFLEFHLS